MTKRRKRGWNVSWQGNHYCIQKCCVQFPLCKVTIKRVWIFNFFMNFYGVWVWKHLSVSRYVKVKYIWVDEECVHHHHLCRGLRLTMFLMWDHIKHQKFQIWTVTLEAKWVTNIINNNNKISVKEVKSLAPLLQLLMSKNKSHFNAVMYKPTRESGCSWQGERRRHRSKIEHQSVGDEATTVFIVIK